MKSIRDLAEESNEIKDAVLEYGKPVKDLMNSIFKRLNMKG